MEDAYTHKDLAELCSVSETTIKSYRRKFPGYIPVLTRGKPIRFRKEAGEVCLAIRDCFAKGLSVDETLAELGKRFTPAPGSASRPAPARVAVQAAPAAESGNAGVTPAQLEKFFVTAARMMQGMAALATAQAKSERRMEKVETALDRLLEQAADNNMLFSRLFDQPGSPAPDISLGPTSTGDGTSAPEKVRARRIVNVRDRQGEVRSYALEKEAAAEPSAPEASETALRPPEDILDTPVVIRTEQDEFLGMPGRVPLSGFITALEHSAAERRDAPVVRWEREGEHWIYLSESSGGGSQTFRFSPTTTPRGNRVILLDRLTVDGRLATSRFLQEFFRQLKDRR